MEMVVDMVELFTALGVKAVESLGLKKVVLRRGENAGDIITLLNDGDGAKLVMILSFESKERRERALELIEHALKLSFGNENQKRQSLQSLKSYLASWLR